MEEIYVHIYIYKKLKLDVERKRPETRVASISLGVYNT